MEILAFVIIGVIAGLAAANFVIFHKYLTKQLPKIFKTLNQRSVLYPFLCGLIYSTLTFPGKKLSLPSTLSEFKNLNDATLIYRLVKLKRESRNTYDSVGVKNKIFIS